MVEQRWREGRDSFVSPATVINTDRYGVNVVDSDKLASSFVCRHHYSGSFPAAVFRVGLERVARGGGTELVGMCVFGVPAQRKSITAWTNLPGSQGVVLSRFVLLDDVPFNGETWFLARAFDALKQGKPHIETVLSYSDPMPRHRADGTTIMPGHVGTIYQAFNGSYHGRSRPRTYWFDPMGRIFDNRSFSKIRNQEKGADAAYERLVRVGARRRRPGESWEAYVLSVKAESFRRVRTRGNHVYTWPLIPPFGKGLRKRERRRLAAAMKPPPGLPYPKEIDAQRENTGR